jgi:hypothetical protein
MAEVIFLVLILAVAAFAAMAEIFGYDSRDHESRTELGDFR